MSTEVAIPDASTSRYLPPFTSNLLYIIIQHRNNRYYTDHFEVGGVLFRHTSMLKKLR